MQLLAQTLHALFSMPCLFVALGAPATRRAWAKDRLGRYFWANANFAGDLGFHTPVELTGRPTVELWPNCWQEITRIDNLVIERGEQVIAHREELEFPDGSMLVAVTRVPLVDEKGVVVGVAGFYDAPATEEWVLRQERQLLLEEIDAEGRHRVAERLRAVAEELSA